MKIAMIGQKGVPSVFGGVETHVTELATRLVRAGHSVVAYARTWYTPAVAGYTPRGASFNGIRVIRLPSVHTKNLDAISHTLISTIHACLFVRPDVYHFHAVGPALLSFIPRLLAPNAKVLVTFHCIDREHAKWGAFARFMLALGERAAVTFPHETIVVSKVLREYVLEKYGVKATYIPNGISPRRTSADPILLAPYGLEPFGYIAMVSRLVKHKGAHTLIEAWKVAKLAKPELFKNLKLAIVGDSAFTDAYVAELHELAREDESIVFTGYRNGEVLESLYMGARFMVHPSTNEGLPIVVLEAMSYGKATLVADIPENLEVINEYGESFKAGDVNDLAEHLIALTADPMHAAALGHVARVYVEDTYNWDTIGEKTERLYHPNLVTGKVKLAIE